MCALGRETFMCPVEISNDAEKFEFKRDDCIAGSWRDATNTRYSLMNLPGDTNRYVKVKSATDPIAYPVGKFRFSGALRLAPAP